MQVNTFRSVCILFRLDIMVLENYSHYYDNTIIVTPTTITVDYRYVMNKLW